MNFQNEKEKLHSEWTTSAVLVLMVPNEVKHVETLQTEHFATIALDILIRKLLEVQEESYTKDSYKVLQHAIFDAINKKPIDIARASDRLIIAAGSLQANHFIMESHHQYEEYSNRENPIRNAGSVLRNTLQAILFNVQQFPYNEMTDRSVRQIKQTMQFAKEAIDQNATTLELVLALRSILGSLLDIQLLKKDKLEN